MGVIAADLPAFAYVTASTLVVFAAFGLVLGRQADELLRRLSTDALTGLLNRRAFLERLDQEHERSRRYPQPLSVLMLDVDGLKGINDRGGHAAGDAALRAIGDAIRCGLRATDIGCRFGGDEFAVMAPEADAAAARVLAERIRCLAEGMSLPGGLRVTVSLGVACAAPAKAGRRRESWRGRTAPSTKPSGRDAIASCWTRRSRHEARIRHHPRGGRGRGAAVASHGPGGHPGPGVASERDRPRAVRGLPRGPGPGDAAHRARHRGRQLRELPRGRGRARGGEARGQGGPGAGLPEEGRQGGQCAVPDVPRQRAAGQLRRRRPRAPRRELRLLPQRARLQVRESAAEDRAGSRDLLHLPQGHPRQEPAHVAPPGARRADGLRELPRPPRLHAARRW